MGKLLDKVLGKAASQVCPACSGTEEVRKIGTLEIGDQVIAVYVCKDARWQISDMTFDKERKKSCRYTGFGVLSDGYRFGTNEGIIRRDWIDRETDRRMYEDVPKTDGEMIAQVERQARELLKERERVARTAAQRVQGQCANHVCRDCGTQYTVPSANEATAGGGH
jgi:hypothetical protein